MRWILLWELFVWEMHKKIECLHLRRWLKRDFSQVWHCVISTSLQSLADKWEAPSQRGDVQDHRCQHFHTHSVTDLQSRWSQKGSSPRIALQHTVHPASFPHSSHPFLVESPWRWTLPEGKQHAIITFIKCFLSTFFLFQDSVTVNITWLWLQKLSQTHTLEDGHRMAFDSLGLLPKVRNRNNQKKKWCLSRGKCSSTDKLTQCRKAKIRNPWTDYPSNEKLFAVLGHPLLRNKLLLNWVHLFSQPSKCVQLRVHLWWKWKWENAQGGLPELRYFCAPVSIPNL